MKLTVLVPALTWRARGAADLLRNLNRQASEEVEILSLCDNATMSLGEKMNHLVAMSKGDYVSTVADDDEVADDYVESILRGIDLSPDCVTFDIASYDRDSGKHVIIRCDPGQLPRNAENIWYRSVGPIAAIRGEIVRQFKYPDLSHGEDEVFAEWVKDKIRSSVRIPRVLYRCPPLMGNRAESAEFHRSMGRSLT